MGFTLPPPGCSQQPELFQGYFAVHKLLRRLAFIGLGNRPSLAFAGLQLSVKIAGPHE